MLVCISTSYRLPERLCRVDPTGSRLGSYDVCGQNHQNCVEGGFRPVTSTLRQLGSTTFVNSPPRGVYESGPHLLTKVRVGQPEVDREGRSQFPSTPTAVEEACVKSLGALGAAQEALGT